MRISPWFDANPDYLRLLTRGQPTKNVGWMKEMVTLTIVDEFGRLLHDSGRLDPNQVRSYEKSFDIHSRSRKFRAYLTYQRHSHVSSPRATYRVPLSTSPQRNGKTRITFLGKDPLVGRAVRKGRTTVTLKTRSLKGSRTKSPRSSNLRPNPEQLSTSYAVVNEQMDPYGNYTISVVPTSRIYYTRIWSGVRTPGYGHIRKSSLPINAHSVSISRVDTDMFAWHRTDVSNPSYYNYAGALTTKFNVPGEPTHLGQARSKAIRNLVDNSGQGLDANLAQDLAQIGQTLSLIGNTARSIAGAVGNLKHGNIPGAINSLFGSSREPRFRKGGKPSVSKSLASNWLELQYGWKPLLQDIHGSMNSLAKLNLGSTSIHQVTGSGTHKTVEQTYSPDFNYPSLRPQCQVTYVTTHTVCRFGMRYRVASPLRAFLAQTGFTNPINLVWEVLPYSFVVDWFLPIGPFLETLSSWDGLEFFDGYQTTFTRQLVVSTVSAAGQIPGGYTVDSKQGNYSREWVKLNREKLLTFPGANLPSLKNGLNSVTHAANGIALLISAFK